MLAELIDGVRELIDRKDWTVIRSTIINLPEPEIAELLFEIDPADRMVLFRLLSRDVSSEVFALLEFEQQNILLDELTQEETRRLLSELSPDDRTQLFEELPGNITQKLLNLLSPEDLRHTRQLLGYPPESVGRLMTPDYVAVRPEWTIGEALNHLKKKGHDSETIDVLYVVNKSWELLDALDLRRFILTDVNTKVAEIMDAHYIYLEATQDREEAVHMMERYDVTVLPVIDTKGILLGIVTFDDILDVAQAEATEDFHRTAAVSPIKGSYRDARFTQLYTKRIGWLLALVFTNILSGVVIANFSDIIEANVALVFFLPLLIGSSGNAGSQASTLMVRALAMGEVKTGDWWQLMQKEVIVSTSLGLTMAIAVSFIGYWRDGFDLALTVALSMSLVVVIGSVMGTALPFILTSLKLDPATASAPLITSLADISGVLIYLSIASIIIQSI